MNRQVTLSTRGILSALLVLGVISMILPAYADLIGDVNGDGRVDGEDFTEAAAAFASYGPDFQYPDSQEHPRWNADADINGDNVVDGIDLVTIAINFGKSEP